MSEAHRLGLEMSMNLSTCGGSLRAPWDTGQQAPKSLVWTAVDVPGPRRVTCVLPRQQGPQAWDVALLAARIGSRRNAAGSPRLRPTRDDEIRFGNDPNQWRPVDRCRPKRGTDAASEVVDLTDKVDAQGRLAWDVPAGRWRIIRFLYTVTEGARVDVDMLDAKAVETYFRRFSGGPCRGRRPAGGKDARRMSTASAGRARSPTWTLGFEQEFAKYRGYSLRPYLPVLAGMTVQSPGGLAAIPARLQPDAQRLLHEQLLRQAGRTVPRGGHQVAFRVGRPLGREQPLLFRGRRPGLLGPQRHAARRVLVAEEAPTVRSSNARLAAIGRAHLRQAAGRRRGLHPHESALVPYPATLKPNADAAFCDGINRFIWHTFSASPAEFGKPGIVYFAGTHLNPNVTWWEQAGAFPDLSRPLPDAAAAGPIRGRRVLLPQRQELLDWIRDRRGANPPMRCPTAMLRPAQHRGAARALVGRGRQAGSARRDAVPSAGGGSGGRVSACRSRCERSANWRAKERRLCWASAGRSARPG